MPDLAREAEEARVIDRARARAARRVESTIRQLDAVKAEAPVDTLNGADLEKTQIIPVVTDVEAPEAPAEVVAEDAELDTAQGRHRVFEDDNAEEATPAPAPEPVAPASAPVAPLTAAARESDDERLRRLLAFVVHQEPRLNWAVGDRPDGTTVLVTDFAHGWIPPGIAIPDGVRLLEPERRTGKVCRPGRRNQARRDLRARGFSRAGWMTSPRRRPRRSPARCPRSTTSDGN